MNRALGRILQRAIVPAVGLVAVAASTGFTHAQGPIINTTPATIAGLEGGTVVHPGDVLKVDGANFGTDGLVCLTWSQTLYDAAFDQGGHFCFSAQDWQPTRIIAQVPAAIDGVTQQTVQLAVDSDQHGESNKLALTFKPTLVVVQVVDSPTQDPVTVTCGGTGDVTTNLCNEINSYHGRPGCPFYEFLDCFSPNEEGTDTYSLHLKNGWGFVYASLGVQANQGSATVTSVPTPLAANGTVVVDWVMFHGEDQLLYTITISASGPKGVPFS